MPPFNKNSSYGPLTASLVCVTRPIFHFCPPPFLVLQQHLQLSPQLWSFSRDLTVLDLKTWPQQVFASQVCVWPEVQTTVCVLWPFLLCGGLMCSSQTTFQFISSPGRRPWTIGFERPARSSTVCWPESQAGGTAACCYTLVDRDAKTWAWRSLGGGGGRLRKHTHTQTCTHTHNVAFKMPN